jgi:hypothetical protein
MSSETETVALHLVRALDDAPGAAVLVAAIDKWAAAAKVTRSEAMRRLIEAGLTRRQRPK